MQPYKNIQVQDESEFVGDATRQIDQLVQFFQLLLALSVGIAILGIVNTLALSVLERTRELGLLRAVGMSRRQVKRMVRVEAVLVSVFGGLLGLAVGVIFGVALQKALVSQGVTELSFPVGAAGAVPAAGRGRGGAGGMVAGPPRSQAQRPAGGRDRLTHVPRYGAGRLPPPGAVRVSTLRTAAARAYRCAAVEDTVEPPATHSRARGRRVAGTHGGRRTVPAWTTRLS